MNYNKIEWFEPEIIEDRYTVTVESTGQLRLSKELLSLLPKSIVFGFDKCTRTMFIRECIGNSGYKPKTTMQVRELPTAIKEIGLKLPIRFRFARTSENKFWIGNILIIKTKNGFDLEQLFIVFEPLANRLVHKLGKSIPKEERRSIITLAFCEALNEYKNIYGNLGRFIKTFTENSLIKENKYYAKHYDDTSLDKHIATKQGNFFSLHDCIASKKNAYEEMEEKMLSEQFMKTLTMQEQKVMSLFSQGYTVHEISSILKISFEEVQFIGSSIGAKRREYYKE